MTHSDLIERIEQVAERDGRYRKDAYFFVFEALQYTVNSLHLTGESRHVTGQQLLHGIAEHGLEQFGPMTKTVFEYWGVRETRDFGEIVFNLVKARLMGKTEDDNIDDFTGVYDFDTEFDWRKAIGRKFKKS